MSRDRGEIPLRRAIDGTQARTFFAAKRMNELPPPSSSPADSSAGMQHPVPHQGAGAFAPTQWSLVWAAGGKSEFAAGALEKLYRAYLPPVRAFFRREGCSFSDTEDLAQEFFYRLLATHSLANASQEKGRFRSWLIGALKHFLHNEWRRGMTQRRGQGQQAISLDALDPATRQSLEPRDNETPETAHDRHWAETLVSLVHARMKREYELVDQLERWSALKGYLLLEAGGPGYAQTAAELGISEAAVKSAIFKLRQRFARLLRHEVEQTVADPSDTEDELRALLQNLRD
jgi:RNA polymerase sigma factor (sigma-70 family)